MLMPTAALVASLALLASAPPATPSAASIAVVPQLGHTQPMLDVLFAPGAAYVATSASDGTVKLWTPDGQLLRTLNVSSAGSRPRIAVSPDGGRIAVTVSSGVELWSAQGKRLGAVRMDAGLVGAVAWAPDGSGFVACTRAARRPHCQAFDAGGKSLATLEVPPDAAGILGGTVGVAVAPGGEPIYAAAGRSVLKWSRTGQLLARFETGKELVSAIALSPDGTRLATATEGLTTELGGPGDPRAAPRTRIWDPDGRKVADVPSHASSTIAFSSDGQWLVSGGTSDGQVLILDRDGRLVKRLAVGGKGALSPAHLALSPDRSQLVVADERFKPVVLRSIDLDGRLLARFGGGTSGVSAVALDPSGSVIASVAHDGQVRLWTLDGRLVGRFRAADESPEVLAVDPGGRFLVTGTQQLEAWSAGGRVLGRARTPRGVYARSVAFAPDGKTFYVGDSAGALTAVPLAGGGKGRITSVFARNEDVSALAVSPSGDAIAVGGSRERFRVLDARGAVKVAHDAPKAAPGVGNAVQGLAFTPDGAALVVATGTTGRQLSVFDRDGNLLRQADTGNRFLSGTLALSPSGRLAAVTVNETIGLYDVATLERRALLRGHTGHVNALAFTKDERHLVSGAGDGTMRVWNVESGASFALLSRGDEWVIFTDDGYFDASRRGADLVALVDGVEAFGVDQLAVRFNRPDLIYQRVGVGTPELIEHLRLQHEDRLRRAGVRGEAGGVDAPRVRIASQRQDGDVLELTVDVGDAARELQALQVDVNGVPLHPGMGRPLDGHRAERTERVTLGEGRSRVEVTAVNRDGLVSRRAGVVVERPARAPGVLWFVGLGVSRYRDPQLDLRFAAKDVSALAAALRKARGRYRDVKTLELTDARATRASLDEIRAFLAPAAVDDTVILLASGHGARTPDALATFRFVTHEADRSDLAGTTVSLDELEGILGGVAARRRLLLVDACQSGELDPETLAAAEARAGAGGLAARVTPGAAGASAPLRPYLYVRDRYVYERLDRRTGATVFASSLGSEVSLESPALGNGVFTAAVLRVLAAPAADGNRDGWISLDELEGAVKGAVVQATGGLQHPTVERDNPLQDLRLPALR
jgi:WD40 repeat protein